MQIDIGQQTNPGPREGPNQDSLRVIRHKENPDVTLLVVADGMGGAAAGDYASRVAVDVICKEVFAFGIPEADEAEERLEDAIILANETIFEKAQAEPEMEGMGCTVVAILILDDLYWIASVGDSRAYLLRDGNRKQLTDDHTWVNARVREGVLTPAQVENHPYKHVLDRAVGTRATIDVDIRPDEIFEPGDSLVICTDGLYGVIDEDLLDTAFEQDSAQLAADWLINTALKAPANDNLTVVTLRVIDF